MSITDVLKRIENYYAKQKSDLSALERKQARTPCTETQQQIWERRGALRVLGYVIDALSKAREYSLPGMEEMK